MSYGKGKLVYVGTLLRGANLDAFMAWLKDLAGVQVNLVTPAGVRAYERQSQTHRLLFLLNFSEDHPHPAPQRLLAGPAQPARCERSEPCASRGRTAAAGKIRLWPRQADPPAAGNPPRIAMTVLQLTVHLSKTVRKVVPEIIGINTNFLTDHAAARSRAGL
jgi:hypothetical protein